MHPSGALAVLYIQLGAGNHAILCCFPHMAVASKELTYLKCLQGLNKASQKLLINLEAVAYAAAMYF